MWNQPEHQATITAVITDDTLQVLPETLNPSQDGYPDTAGPHSGQTAAGAAPAASRYWGPASA